jgi:hypothetical protein
MSHDLHPQKKENQKSVFLFCLLIGRLAAVIPQRKAILRRPVGPKKSPRA